MFAHVNRTLTEGGHFVFTIEHPIFTAEGTQDWCHDKQGQSLHWPVDHYFHEGRRESSFLGENVVKYHHTLTTILQGLLQNGFTLRAVVEPQPTPEMLADIPGMADELRRPMMLSVATVKQNAIQ